MAAVLPARYSKGQQDPGRACLPAMRLAAPKRKAARGNKRHHAAVAVEDAPGVQAHAYRGAQHQKASVMDVKFGVHNPHQVPIVRQVDIDGETAEAIVNGFEVELQTLDGASGTLKLRFSKKDDIAAAMALFVVDTIVIGSFAALPPVPESA